MQGLGAYFGSTRINQGAAGLGDDTGPLQAYADGSVGGQSESADTPGPLFAYHDGSLGDDASPLQAYADGSVGGQADNADSPGPLQAYRDGALGSDDDSEYRDGILGGHYEGMSTFGPLQAYHDGALGADATPAAVGGLTLDLGDAATLAEVKSLMALSSGGYALSTEAQKTYTPDWYTSGIWEPSASALWQFIVSAIPQMQGKAVSGSAQAQTYPNGTGLGILVGLMAAPTAGGGGPEYLKSSMPHVYAWFAGGGGDVLPPYLSLADKTREERAGAGGGPMMSTMAMAGLGAVALLGVALIWRRRRR